MGSFLENSIRVLFYSKLNDIKTLKTSGYLISSFHSDPTLKNKSKNVCRMMPPNLISVSSKSRVTLTNNFPLFNVSKCINMNNSFVTELNNHC